MADPPRFRCATLIMTGKSTTVKAPGSEHVGLGVIRKQPNEYVK